MTEISSCGNMLVYSKIIEADYESIAIEKGVSIEVFSGVLPGNLPASVDAPFFIGVTDGDINSL